MAETDLAELERLCAAATQTYAVYADWISADNAFNTAAKREVPALIARVRALEAALRPFAEWADKIDGMARWSHLSREIVARSNGVPLDALDVARAALPEKPTP